MLPELYRIGNFPIHTFGLMVAMGFITATWWSKREAIRLGFDPQQIVDLCFALMVSGLIGSRVLFVIVNWKSYAARPYELLYVWQGGLVWYGGLIGAFIAGYFLLRRYKLPGWQTSDLIVPGVAFGHAFGRLGCLAAGDDHGKLIVSALGPKAQKMFHDGLLFATDGRLTPKAIATIRVEGYDAPWWSLIFDAESLVQRDLVNMPLYPAQLVMSGYVLLFFIILTIWRKYKRFEGELTALLFVFYGIARYLLEYIRGDLGRGFVFGAVSTSQFISMGLFTFGIGLYIYLYKQHQRKLSPKLS